MASNILFVFEGEKTEKQITDSLLKSIFNNENTIIQCAYCNDIYELYKEIKQDEDLDTFSLLSEIPYNVEILSEYSRIDFAEIYMFFDYDGHDTIADDKKVMEVINFFKEETSTGKLFISYPMVEALKHFSDDIEFKTLKVRAKENIGYKQIVDFQAHKTLKQINKYSKEIWLQLIELHLNKTNHLVNEDYSLPKNIIHQNDIFLKQLEKYINVDSTVAVLSSFPVFLFDYYGYKYICRLLNKDVE